MKYALALAAVAGLANVATAQTTNVVLQVSRNGNDWVSAINDAAPGETIFVRMRYILSGATAQGFAGGTCQPTLSNWNAAGGDVRNAFTFPGVDNGGVATTETAYDGRHVRSTPSSNTGRIFPFGSNGQGVSSSSGLLTSFNDAGNILRFAGSKNTTATTNVGWGLAAAQNPQQIAGTNFVSDLDVVSFRYSITLGPSNAARTLVATAGNFNLNRGTWHTQANGLNPLNANIGTVTEASISIVPTPGSLALLGLGGLAAARRRR